MSFIAEKLPEDRVFETALHYCFSPLQGLPFGERALAFVEPYEYWALLFVREGNSLSAFSTENQESRRRREGWNYSLNSLESGLQRSLDLKGALSRFDDTWLLPLLSAQSINVMSAIGSMASEITSIAGNQRFHYGSSDKLEEALEPRLRAYMQELLSEHLGIDIGLQFFSDKTRVAASREIASRETLSPVALKPIKAESIYRRGQPHMNLRLAD